MFKVVTGDYGAGKTSYIHEHYQVGDIVVSWEDIRFSLAGHGEVDYRLVTDAFFAIIRRLAKKTIDGNVWIETHLKNDVVAVLQENETDFEVIDLDSTETMKTNKQPLQKQAQLARAVFAGEKKAPDTFTDGMFTGYASTWTATPDAYGDTVVKGAFKDTLTRWTETGGIIPVLYGHDTSDPMNNIGAVTDVVEDEYGLKVTCKLDIEDNPVAMQVWRLMKARRLREMSFAYFVTEGDPNKHGGLDLKAVDLLEVSVVMVGANRTALIDTPKHDETAITPEAVNSVTEVTPNTVVEPQETAGDETSLAEPNSGLGIEGDTSDNMVQNLPTDAPVQPTDSSDIIDDVDSPADTSEELPNTAGAGGVGGSLDATARARLTLLEMYLREKTRGA